MLPMDETSPPTSDEERTVRSASNSPQSCHPSSSVTASASDATAFPEGMSALRRNLHPESSKQVLQTWLEENLDHPYPLEEKKLEFMSQTGLTMKQINYWFINARRRKVKSMRQQQYYRHAAANRAAGAFHTLEASTHPYHNMHRDRADHTLDSHYSTPQSASAYTATPFSGQSPTTLPSPTGHALHHLTTTASTTPMVASSLTTQPHFHAQQPHPHHGQTQQNLHQQQHPQLVQRPGAIEHSLQHSLNPLPARHHQATVWGQSNTATVTSQARATVGEWSTQAQQITSVPRNPPRTLQVAQATTSARHHGMESPQGNFRSPFTLTSSGGIPAATFPTAQQQQQQHQQHQYSEHWRDRSAESAVSQLHQPDHGHTGFLDRVDKFPSSIGQQQRLSSRQPPGPGDHTATRMRQVVSDSQNSGTWSESSAASAVSQLHQPDQARDSLHSDAAGSVQAIVTLSHPNIGDQGYEQSGSMKVNRSGSTLPETKTLERIPEEAVELKSYSTQSDIPEGLDSRQIQQQQQQMQQNHHDHCPRHHQQQHG
eukprot:scpid64349/ scgid5942/ Homeobox protein meis3